MPDGVRIHSRIERNMWEFFTGWRRKTGAATLVLALALVGVWARSFLSTNDSFRVWENHSLYSHNGFISWNIQHVDHSNLDVFGAFRKPEVKWRWEYCCVVGSYTTTLGSTAVEQYWIPYWYFIVPLTAISACLLLSKPRVANPSTDVKNSRFEP